MKKKGENLIEMSKGEIEKKLNAVRENLRSLQFNTHGTKSKNVKESMNLRKEIARMLTVLNNKHK